VTAGYQEQFKDSASADIYAYWHRLYYLLATLPLDDIRVRQAPETLVQFKEAHWGTDANVIESYWRRVTWVAGRSTGNVLEVGCGMGNITRWIANNPAVEAVLAMDLLPTYVAELQQFYSPKVTAVCDDVTSAAIVEERATYDTVVLSEIIEHLSFDQEVGVIRAARKHLRKGGRWLITTPINFMPDPDHVKGFMRWYFRLRVRLLYGSIVELGENTDQQFAWAVEAQSAFQPFKTALARLLDFLFVTRSSGEPWKSLRRWLGPVKKRLGR
jgi:SAM-dependent methyltransferase